MTTDPWDPGKTTKKIKHFKNEYSIKNLWENIRRSNICDIGVPELETDWHRKQIFKEIVTKNLLNFVKDMGMSLSL